jgi:glycerol uptake facilitator-like aquaporin
MTPDLSRRCVAEALGTALLIIAVIGSGIMATRLSPDDVGLQLLENAIATGGALVALILTFGSVSGAHFNPIVTWTERSFGLLDSPTAIAATIAQVVGGCVGTMTANVMFDLPVVEFSTKDRSTGNLLFSEAIAAFGLLIVIFGIVRSGKGAMVPYAVGGWITGAYWFTSSTSFANPAVTVARMLSDSFAGIKPSSAPMFIVMQLVGMIAAGIVIRFLWPTQHTEGSTP